jgi:hypothetical protein
LTLLFSDGSLSFTEDNKKQVGAAFVRVQGETPICESLHPLPSYWGIFDVELYCAYQALLYATSLNPPPPTIYLHLDNQAAIYTIAHPSSSSSAQTVRKIVQAITFLKSNNTEVHIGWTPGHIGIVGNELADKAAKCAATLPCDQSLPWTPTGIRSDLRAQLLQDWLSTHTSRPEYSDSPSLSLNPIFDLPRMQATRIFQMQLSHSYLLAHPVWFRPDPLNCPRCDLELETTEHTILHCPERQYARDLFPKDLDLGLAWMSPEQLKIIGDFIIRTQTGYPPTITTTVTITFSLKSDVINCVNIILFLRVATFETHFMRSICPGQLACICRTYLFFGFITSCCISLLYVIKIPNDFLPPLPPQFLR